MSDKNVWVKGQNDNEFKNSVGFFRDPFTGKDFDESTVEVKRVPGHKYAHIYASDGKTVIPVSSKFWTRAEKDAYNEERKNGTSMTGDVKKSSKNEDLRKGLLELKEYLTKANKMDAKIEKYIAAIMPADPEQERLAKKVAGMSEEQKAMLKALLG